MVAGDAPVGARPVTVKLAELLPAGIVIDDALSRLGLEAAKLMVNPPGGAGVFRLAVTKSRCMPAPTVKGEPKFIEIVGAGPTVRLAVAAVIPVADAVSVVDVALCWTPLIPNGGDAH